MVWTMTSPRRGPVDVASVDALLRELELAKRLREAPATDASGLDGARMLKRIQDPTVKERLLRNTEQSVA